MRVASALSRRPDTIAAVEEATERLARGLDGEPPDLLFAFVSSHHGARLERAVEGLAAVHPHAVRIGCSADHVIGEGREAEGGPGLALCALRCPGAALRGFHWESDRTPDASTPPAAWWERTGASAESRPDFVLLADPFGTDVEAVLRGFDTRAPGAVVVGGLASGGRAPGEVALWQGDRVLRGGVVGLALSGAVALEAVVAQGCRPVGQPMFVTHARDNVIHAVDGRPPLEVLSELFQRADADERRLFQTSLFIGLEMRAEQTEYQRGDFLIRNVVGGDPESGALSVAAPVRVAQVVQFHLRDAGTAARDLDERLTAHPDPAAARGALLFSCLGRGVGLFGEPDHDSRAFRRRVADVPITGFFANGEIGPVQHRTFLHGYTSAFGIFRERR